MEKKAGRSDQDFQKVTYPVYGSCDCSPEVPEEFRGLRIRMPRKVRLPATGPPLLNPDAPWLPVCGVIRLDSQELAALGVDSIEGVVLVFVDGATGKPISFYLQPDKSRAPSDAERPSDVVVLDSVPEDQIDRSHVFNDYFAIDALMFRPDFPLRAARYHVHALLGKNKSNVVEVEVDTE